MSWRDSMNTNQGYSYKHCAEDAKNDVLIHFASQKIFLFLTIVYRMYIFYLRIISAPY